MKRTASTEMDSTGTKHAVPKSPAGAKISYLVTDHAGSVYLLPISKPSTKEERRRLRETKE